MAHFRVSGGRCALGRANANQRYARAGLNARRTTDQSRKPRLQLGILDYGRAQLKPRACNAAEINHEVRQGFLRPRRGPARRSLSERNPVQLTTRLGASQLRVDSKVRDSSPCARLSRRHGARSSSRNRAPMRQPAMPSARAGPSPAPNPIEPWWNKILSPV